MISTLLYLEVAWSPNAVVGAPSSREESLIAVVSAYGGEMEAVRRMVEGEVIEREESINGVRFALGSVYGMPAVFFITRVSMTNAAMTTQLALDRFPIRMLLFSGIAGGVNRDLLKGDVAVPAQWHHHAKGAYFNEDRERPGAYLYPEGSAVRFSRGHFGFHHPTAVSVIRDGLAESVSMEFFRADDSLLNLAEKAAATVELRNASGRPATVKLRGNGAAGPVFMDNAAYREFLYKEWASDIVDMESTAIAQVCWANRVPFIIVRGISDLAGAQNGLNEIDEHADLAATNAARLLGAILRELAKP